MSYTPPGRCHGCGAEIDIRRRDEDRPDCGRCGRTPSLPELVPGVSVDA